MTTGDTVNAPNISGLIDQTFFLRPLNGADSPETYLSNFPEEIYNTSVDSRLTKFLYTLLGPAGNGWIRSNYLQARLILEDAGLDTFDLDAFYGDPISFGRILEETYDINPDESLSRGDWERIRVKDARYKSRALDFVAGARAGNTLLGMQLVSKSGLGHDVTIIEQYRYIYDQLSDDSIGLDNYGQTDTTGEFIILPRSVLPVNEIQILTIDGTPDNSYFQLVFPQGDITRNTTEPIYPASGSFNATAIEIQGFLEELYSIGIGNVLVSGGPLPDFPIKIQFIGDLGNKDVPQLQVINQLNMLAEHTELGGATITISTQREGVDQSETIASISDRDKRYLHEALGKIKPVSSIVTYAKSKGIQKQQTFNSVFSEQSFIEVARFVTGSTSINWPQKDNTHWIESSIEHQAPKQKNFLQSHYQGFHNIVSIISYTEANIGSTPTRSTNDHIGDFSALQKILYSPLVTQNPSDFVYTTDQALADYAEPLIVENSNNTPLINGIYPIDYSGLAGVPGIRYKYDQFWSSLERNSGEDYLEIDLGTVQPVNYIYFEATQKPYNIEVDYELLDDPDGTKIWNPVSFSNDISSTTSIGYDLIQNVWNTVELNIQTSNNQLIYTRYLRLRFIKRFDDGSIFTGTPNLPFSIEIRNLRVARNVI